MTEELNNNIENNSTPEPIKPANEQSLLRLSLLYRLATKSILYCWL
ncbi:MAG: hypothetical protein ACOYMF_15570 [Bacteroidales bacterium]